jgi:hypothetical protein
MNIFGLELWDDEAKKCTFYTVRKENALQNETDKFFCKYNSMAQFKLPTQLLLSFILDSVGNDHGAISQLFNRFENEVIGLPNKGEVCAGEFVFQFPDFPLRLYAMKVNNRTDLVVLFNGGVKTAQTNQASRGLYLKWREACQFANRIEEAIRNKEIIIDNEKRKLLSTDNSEEIIL